MTRSKRPGFVVPGGLAVADDWQRVVLQPDELLLLRPKMNMTTEALAGVVAQIPEQLRGRVVVIDPTAFDVTIIRKLD